MAGYIDQEGIERQCPHTEYGDRIPTHEDITALVNVFHALLIRRHETEQSKQDYLTGSALVSQVLASYCRQFRDVAGPKEQG